MTAFAHALAAGIWSAQRARTAAGARTEATQLQQRAVLSWLVVL